MRNKDQIINNSHEKLTEVLLELARTHEKEKVFELIINHLKSTIKGSGCSIFLVDPSTDKLYLVASSDIKKEDFNNCIYERGQGFTGWVFKNKSFIYIEDESDEDKYKKQYIDINHKSGDKPYETKSVGPFMAAPILSNDYVTGVIRLPAVKGRKNYTKIEQDLFKTFAAKLSESIENADLIEKHNILIHTYAEIGKADDIPKLLQLIVDYIPNIVGGGGCSIFLFEGERDDKGKKKFSLKATTSVKKEFRVFVGRSDKYTYTEGGTGLTAWVATTGKPIRIQNIDDTNELAKYIESEDINIPPEHIGGPCEIDDVGPFMAAPIKDENDVIGVIRIPRRKQSKPFEEIDQELFVAFAAQLSLTIINIQRKKKLDDMRKNRANEFETVFSTKLIEKCRTVSKVDYANEIVGFFSKSEQNEDIDIEILDMLEILWCNKYEEKYNFPLLRDFKGYEKLLFELPRYRDHFIHQYQVFLLGTVIIDGLYKLSDEKKIKNFSDYYNESLNINNRGHIFADIAWLITSTFHDIAYPIQESDELFDRFFNRFMDLGENIIDKIGIEKIISDRRYGKLIDQLCNLYFSLQNAKGPWKYEPSDIINVTLDGRFRWDFQQCLIKKRDHGVLGSLILLHKSEAGKNEYSTIIYPSALAIALHNKLLLNIHDYITFEKNPLAFLLIYCDLVQEWGRGEKDVSWGRSAKDVSEIPTLKKIDVFVDNEFKIHVKTEIRLENPELTKKKDLEAESVFDKLKSNEIIFEFVIENNGRCFNSTKN